ncbi:hypothetical protein ACLMJK_001430 [Lecanora helva]
MTLPNWFLRFSIFAFIGLVLSAPSTSPLGTAQSLSLDIGTQDSTLPPINSTPIVNLTAGKNGGCATSSRFQSWRTKDWKVEDCYAAVHGMFIAEVLTHPNQAFEFVDKGASATKPNLNPQRTPRKYVVGSFLPGDVPNGRIFPHLRSDTSTYSKIYAASKALEWQCTEFKNPGWALIGR